MNITKKAAKFKPDYILDNSFEDYERDERDSLPCLSLSEVIESIGLGRFHYILLFVVACNFINTSFQYILPGLLLPSFFKEFELNSFELSLYGFFEYLAYLTGSLFAYFCAERYGRRKMILLTLIIAALLNSICCLAETIAMIIVLRFLTINSLVVNYYYSYAFIVELLPLKFKTNLTIYIQITNFLGTIICIALVSWVFESLEDGNWRILMILASLLIWIAFSLNASILDESPYYNLKKGNSEAAYSVINKMAKFNIKNPEYLNLDKKRMISNWFIKNESKFYLSKKNNNFIENKFNVSLVLIWALDLFIFHGFDFILPIFLVLQKNSINPLFQKYELLQYLLVMHLLSNTYLFLVFCAKKMSFKRKRLMIFLLVFSGFVVSMFLGFNLKPSFYFWMVVFKFLLNSYNFVKLQIISEFNEKVMSQGVNLKVIKIYAKFGMIASTFLLLFFINLDIYLVYFIFAGQFLINFILWTRFQDDFLDIKEDELKKPLNNASHIAYDNIYRIIEIPL